MKCTNPSIWVVDESRLHFLDTELKKKDHQKLYAHYIWKKENRANLFLIDIWNSLHLSQVKQISFLSVILASWFWHFIVQWEFVTQKFVMILKLVNSSSNSLNRKDKVKTYNANKKNSNFYKDWFKPMIAHCGFIVPLFEMELSLIRCL